MERRSPGWPAKTIENWARKTLSWYIDTTGYEASLEKPPCPYSFSATSEVHYFAPSRLISVSIGTGQGGGGGAHPAHGFFAFNFGVIDGKATRLALRDMFRRGFAPRPLVTRLVTRKLREAGARDAVEGRMTLMADELDNFFITRVGLTYAFMPGRLATYAEGPFEATLTISELGPNFRRELVLGR
ncbi:MAG TPA: RsiV family protein [bacterium]|nr:RsiV family protein [bacterium]